MRKLLLSAMLGMFALAGFSQTSLNVKAGMSMTNITDSEMDMKVGYTVGLGVDYQFTNTWYLQSGLNFTGKGAKLSGLKVKSHYMEIPVLAAAKFDIADNMKFVVNAGPYVAVGLGGKAEFEGESFKVFKEYDNKDALLKRFDMGIQYGVGLELSNRYLINLSGQYGFIDTVNNTEESPKNIAFLISLGYRF